MSETPNTPSAPAEGERETSGRQAGPYEVRIVEACRRHDGDNEDPITVAKAADAEVIRLTAEVQRLTAERDEQTRAKDGACDHLFKTIQREGELIRERDALAQRVEALKQQRDTAYRMISGIDAALNGAPVPTGCHSQTSMGAAKLNERTREAESALATARRDAARLREALERYTRVPYDSNTVCRPHGGDGLPGPTCSKCRAALTAERRPACENGDCRDHYGDPLAWCVQCASADPTGGQG